MYPLLDDLGIPIFVILGWYAASLSYELVSSSSNAAALDFVSCKLSNKFEEFNQLLHSVDLNLKFNKSFVMSSGDYVSCQVMKMIFSLQFISWYLGDNNNLMDFLLSSCSFSYLKVINSCDELDTKVQIVKQLNKLSEGFQIRSTEGMMSGCCGAFNEYLV